MFSLGGRADLRAVIAEGGYGNEPYDVKDDQEVLLRGAGHWAGQLAAPTWYIEGAESYYIDGVSMATEARRRGKPMEAHLVPGADHFTAIWPAKKQIIEQIKADTSPEPVFTFSEGGLAAALAEAAD